MEKNEEIEKRYDELLNLQNQRTKLRASIAESIRNYANANKIFEKRISELKRVTKFKEKLKQTDTKSRDTTLAEMETLNLSKYSTEIATTISECVIQQRDLIYFMELAANMVKLYEDFSGSIFENLIKQIKAGGNLSDESTRANRRRNLFRYLIELLMIGFPFSIDKILESLRDSIISNDLDYFLNNITTAATFISHYSYEFIGIVSRTREKDLKEKPQFSEIKLFEDLIPQEKKTKIKDFFTRYIELIKKNLKAHYEKMVQQEQKNNKIIIEKGALDSESESKYKELRNMYQKTLDNIAMISDGLDINIQLEDATDDVVRVVGPNKNDKHAQSTAENLQEDSLFSNEDERSLYCDLIDLKDLIPEILLAPKKEKNLNKTDNSAGEKVGDGQHEVNEPELQIVPTNKGGEVTKEIINDYSKFSAKLNLCMSKDFADELARDFCLLASKINRNKLAQEILEYRQEYNLMLPFLCRIVASLSRYFRDIGEMVCKKLEEDFKNMKDNTKDAYKDQDKRLRNIKYICELTKFKICPSIIILNCLKILLDDFSGQNLILVTTILERAGYFLIKSKESNMRFSWMLDQINKLRKTRNLPHAVDMQIENAILMARPPESLAIKEKRRKSDLEEYIMYLLHTELCHEKLEFVAEELLKLPWTTCENIILKHFMKIVRKGKFDYINLISALLASFKIYYPWVIMRFTDNLIEDIIRDMELNDINKRQKRITTIKYFAELYCFQIIEHNLVFDMLYKLMEFGNEESRAPDEVEYFDSKDDTFRISLICTLLEATGKYLKSKKLRPKIERFLIFFQKYILTKTYLPMLLEFMVLDNFELIAPNIKRFTSLKEAQDECNKLLTVKKEEKIGPNEIDDDQEREIDNVENQQIKSERDVELERLDEMRRTDIKAKKVETEFENEFQMLIMESTEENKNNVSKPLKLNTNQVLKKKPKPANQEEVIDPRETKVSLIIRQGNKVTSKEIGLSSDSKIAQIFNQKAEKEEREKREVSSKTTELHMKDLESIDYIYGEEGFISNRQIKYVQSKK